jgi:hypothetical protein
MSDKPYVYMIVYDDGYEYFVYEMAAYRDRAEAGAVLSGIINSDDNYRLEILELK